MKKRTTYYARVCVCVCLLTDQSTQLWHTSQFKNTSLFQHKIKNSIDCVWVCVWAYNTDLFLSSSESLHLWCVRHDAEASTFALLKVLLVLNLQEIQKDKKVWVFLTLTHSHTHAYTREARYRHRIGEKDLWSVNKETGIKQFLWGQKRTEAHTHSHTHKHIHHKQHVSCCLLSRHLSFVHLSAGC